MHRKINISLLSMLATIACLNPMQAARLANVSVLDREFIVLHIEDGVVEFTDNASGPTAYGGHDNDASLNRVIRFGEPLDTAKSQSTASWKVRSPDDGNFAGDGQLPLSVFRKTKLNGMAEMNWNTAINDYNYEHTLEHFLYLRLPQAMAAGKRYTIVLDPDLGVDTASVEFTFIEAQLRSEAIRVNLHGFLPSSPVMAADLYAWMGDGGARDYSGFVGAPVRLYNVNTQESVQVGTVTFGAPQGGDVFNYDLNKSNWWRADFTGSYAPGTYRLVIDGIGSSADFHIRSDIFKEPFDVATRGYFYMRIGQDSMDAVPVPRRPLWIPRNNPMRPGGDPAGFRVVKTSMHPYHPEWKTFTMAHDPKKSDPWDGTAVHWTPYVLPGSPENPNARGGYSDALDWDRHLDHVSSIHDLLLPYILTQGRPADDNTGIAESGNGIPDLLDSARYEVDFWLRLRDADGYSHGISNIDRNNNIAFLAAPTGVAAWAAAANAAMLAEAFRIAGLTDLKNYYQAAATEAWQFASALPPDAQMLDRTQNVGFATFRGRDFRFMAAAYLFNLTGDRAFEDIVRAESLATSNTATLSHRDQFNQFYASLAYLLCPHTVADSALQARMRASIIHQAKQLESNLSNLRPSRRATSEESGYFHTIQNLQRTIAAHALTTDPNERQAFLRAMILEADWSLGRNPLNRIQMTTATTGLAHLPSVENAYTSGRNDGTPGLHPGHTPYFNMDDWDSSMVMGRPSWMVQQSYPSQVNQWPRGELAFNTRYVWAHSEFTPQQTMRGKQALYSYLHALTPPPVSFVSDLIVYRDSGGILTGTWGSNGTLSELSTGGSEGNRHYRFAYSFSDYWAGFGLNLDNWGNQPAQDLSAMQYLNIDVHGPTTSAAYVAIQLVDSNKTIGPEVRLPVSSSYTHHSIPLTQLSTGSSLNLAQIKEIQVSVSGVQSATGEVFIDNIFFSTPTSALLQRFSDWIASPEFGVPYNLRGYYDTPANDGIANLLKYAFNMPPLVPGAASDALPSITNEAGDEPAVLFTYRRRAGGTAQGIGRYFADGISYIVQVSQTLQADAWQVLSDSQAVQGPPIALANATESVTLRVPTLHHPTLLRLVVEELL